MADVMFVRDHGQFLQTLIRHKPLSFIALRVVYRGRLSTR